MIPNWNGKSLLPICLSSLRRQSFRDFETLVVDNGSTDGSRKLLARDFPEVRVISLGENRGFSAAVNAGIRASEAEYVALLNNDTEQDAGWLAELVAAADATPQAGSFASKLLDFGDRRVLDGAGDVLRRSGLPYRLGHGEIDRGQYDRPRFVFGACAAAALMLVAAVICAVFASAFCFAISAFLLRLSVLANCSGCSPGRYVKLGGASGSTPP